MEKDWFKAVKDNDIVKIKYLLNHSLNIKEAISFENLKNDHGSTALSISSSKGYTEIVELLLNQQIININHIDIFGNSALINASYDEHKTIIKLLLKRPDVNINIRNKHGKNFIEVIKDKSFLNDYNMQMNIIYNGREDILLLFDKYNLLDNRIKYYLYH